MPPVDHARIVQHLATRGLTADREAVTLFARASNPEAAIERAVETAHEDALVLSAEDAKAAIASGSAAHTETRQDAPPADRDPPVSGGQQDRKPPSDGDHSPDETGGFASAETDHDSTSATTISTGEPSADERADSTFTDDGEGDIQRPTNDARAADTATQPADSASPASGDPPPQPVLSGDITSTGTGVYGDFVDVFRSRYQQLAELLRGRLSDRPANAVAELSDGSEAALVGMVADVFWTSGGHRQIELEDRTGTYSAIVLKDSPVIEAAETVLCDEVVAVAGRIAKRESEDEGVLFVEELYTPDVPHTFSPSTADRQVRAALVSDIHVGSQEFLADAWADFAKWLHSPAAADVEYLLIAGDMVEGIGVYPNQDEELDILDIYDQYEQFSEHLKDVPGEMEIVMIPGNHDAVRLAEPQPAFDEELREIMAAHDARISANPSLVTLEGVSILMYHGVSLDEVIAELPTASYERPAEAMTQLLAKRHLAPQYGGKTRIAPEERDHLVIDEVPDVFHAGHVHKFGHTRYRGVLTVNSSCWQAQTDFQKRVNLQPDVGYAPIVDLSTLELQYAQFA